MRYNATAYDTPWRRNYELGQFLVWLAAWCVSGYAAADMARAHGFPDGRTAVWGTVFLVCSVMAFLTRRRAKRLAILQRSIRGAAMDSVSHEELKNLLLAPEWIEQGVRRTAVLRPCDVRSVFLGYGFRWQTRHIQRAIEIIKNDTEDMGIDRAGDPSGGFCDPSGSQVSYGQTWIHGLEPRAMPIWQPLEHIKGHTLIGGTTGAGKTSLFNLLVCQAVYRGECVIIIDPKGDRDLQENARRACAVMGDAGRFANFDLAHPSESVRINPLANFDDPSELASRISVLIPGEDSAFKAFAWQVVQALSEGLVLAGETPTLTNLYGLVQGGSTSLVIRAIRGYAAKSDPGYAQHRTETIPVKAGRIVLNLSAAQIENDEKISIGKNKTLKKESDIESLMSNISIMEERESEGVQDVSGSGLPEEIVAAYWVAYFREFMRERHSNSAIWGLIGLFEHDKEHLQKMITNLIPTLSSLTSGQTAALLTPDGAAGDPRPILDLQRITHSGQVTYVGLNCLANPVVGQAVGSIMLADLANVAGSRYNARQQERDVPINLFVDECSEVANASFVQLLNKARGSGFRITAATQTISDFEQKLGSRAAMGQLLGNFNNVLCMRMKDADSMKYMQDLIVKTRVKTVMRTQGTSTASSHPMMASSSIGERLVEEEHSMVPYELLAMLPNFEFFALVSGGAILKCRFPMLSERRLTVDEGKGRDYEGLLGRFFRWMGF